MNIDYILGQAKGKRQEAKGSFVLPTPYTLHPTPHTLHPTPYTPHPTPYTLHPTPYTPHPTPHTPHPTPYTLHPTPQSLGLVYVSRGEGCDKLIKERLSPSNYGGVTR
ncbi:hypothetical protein [Microcystis sp. M169S2]|uniref:hypothetical protein n=1 Tax=Microcystis sp. M169S2 TaxID=2771157 RepID=UPI0025896D85|nr:hypothetical protein [Microcystis sp. M169S2]MCA2719910.1 hypothetical protein [Microcystis sp. M169S2]